MQVRFTDSDIRAKAVELKLIEPGREVPSHLRSRIVAILLQEAAGHTRRPAPEPQLATEIVIQPGGVILIDGEPFPWLVAQEAMDIRLDPEGFSTVRMTLLANAVQILTPEPRDESE
jgi:hypothetical protein